MTTTAPDTIAPPQTTTPSEAAGRSCDDPLDGVIPLGMHQILSAPGVSASVRRWRYRGRPRVELVIVGIPTDAAGSQLHDDLLRLRARVLAPFIARGMYVFNTERKHDGLRPRMTLVDHLK